MVHSTYDVPIPDSFVTVLTLRSFYEPVQSWLIFLGPWQSVSKAYKKWTALES
jgi:hypothetical protein